MPNSMDTNHNPKARRRNVKEESKPKVDFQQLGNENKSNFEDTNGGFSNGRVPRVPSLTDSDSSTQEIDDNSFNQQDKLLDQHSLNNETSDYEATNKILAIHKALENEPSRSELKLLGCGELGLVNGKLLINLFFCVNPLIEDRVYIGSI